MDSAPSSVNITTAVRIVREVSESLEDNSRYFAASF